MRIFALHSKETIMNLRLMTKSMLLCGLLGAGLALGSCNSKPETNIDKIDNLKKQVQADAKTLNDIEAYVKAAKALGVDLSLAEVEKASAETQELDPEEMGKAAGGVDGDGKQDDVGWCISLYACFTIHHHDTPDREGYPCFADYDCITIYHH